MLPPKIQKEIFKQIHLELKDNDLSVEVSLPSGSQRIQNVLSHSYRLDENDTNSYYKLLDLCVIVPGYSFDVRLLLYE